MPSEFRIRILRLFAFLRCGGRRRSEEPVDEEFASDFIELVIKDPDSPYIKE